MCFVYTTSKISFGSFEAYWRCPGRAREWGAGKHDIENADTRCYLEMAEVAKASSLKMIIGFSSLTTCVKIRESESRATPSPRFRSTVEDFSWKYCSTDWEVHVQYCVFCVRFLPLGENQPAAVFNLLKPHKFDHYWFIIHNPLSLI